MIQFACLCGARHEQASPLPPACWLCGDQMQPYAQIDHARPIGEIVEPIVDDVMLRATQEARA